MKTDLFEIARRGFIPLKELFTVIILIWAGSFLCMIPDLIKENERRRWEAKKLILQRELDTGSHHAAAE